MHRLTVSSIENTSREADEREKEREQTLFFVVVVVELELEALSTLLDESAVDELVTEINNTVSSPFLLKTPFEWYQTVDNYSLTSVSIGQCQPSFPTSFLIIEPR